MVKKNIYLHVGTTKTGTTSIQRFLEHNEELLRREDYAPYTPLQSNDPDVTFRMRSFLNILQKAETKGSLSSEQEQGIKNFINVIRSEECSNLILSEELFWNLSGSPHPIKKSIIEKFIKALMAFSNLTVVVYLRRQDNYLMSSYQQELKNGGMGGLRCIQWVSRPGNDYSTLLTHYYERLEWFAEIVGSGNIKVRVFEKQQYKQNSLIADFMDCVNLDLTEEYQQLDFQRNPGLSPLMCEVFRYISYYHHDKEVYLPLLDSELKTNDLVYNQGKNHNFLSPAARINLVNKYSEENRKVAEKYLSRDNGDLFLDPLPSEDDDWAPFELTPDMVESFFSDASFLDKEYGNTMKSIVLTAIKHERYLNIKIYILNTLEDICRSVALKIFPRDCWCFQFLRRLAGKNG